MFISKKRWQSLEKRIADLEVQVQSQQKCCKVDLVSFKETMQKAAKSAFTM